MPTNEKAADQSLDTARPLPQLPRRTVFSWRSLAPPLAPALRGRATPSTDGRPSGQNRQSSNSDASQWTGAVTQRTDSGIFVPPTALTHPRAGPTSPRDKTGGPSDARELPSKDARKTVRFSGHEELTTVSGRASLISVDSRTGEDTSRSSNGGRALRQI